MKNLLKKIGILLAVLVPFTNLKLVDAAETCEKHLQNYMFLDVNYFALNDAGKTFLDDYDYAKSERGYTTYTRFPYAFSNTPNTKIKVNWIETNNFSTTTTIDELDDYWTYSTNKSQSNSIYIQSDSQKYYKENIGSVFVTDTAKLGTYVDNTLLFHGNWSSDNLGGAATDEEHRVEYSSISELEAISLQKVLANDIQYMNIIMDSAIYKNGRYNISQEIFDTSYFQKIINGELKNTDGDAQVIPISITRGLKLKSSSSQGIDFNNYLFGMKDEDGNIYIYTEKTNVTKLEDINDSYSAYKEFLSLSEEELEEASQEGKSYSIKSSDTLEFDMDDIDFDVTKPYYWPVVLTLEYETCTVSEEVANWGVEYYSNVTDNSVINIPKTQTEKVGTDITLDTGKPTREGYVFKKWCETENGNGTCYNPGDKITSPKEATTVKLFAQWGKTDTEDNKKTGVVSYIIGFAAVGVVAGGIYLISKKKNLFKQI